MLVAAGIDLPEEADEEELGRGLAEFAKQLEPALTGPCPPPEDVEQYAERWRSELLALLFDAET